MLKIYPENFYVLFPSSSIHRQNSTKVLVYIQNFTFPENCQNYTIKLIVLIIIVSNKYVYISFSITNAFF